MATATARYAEGTAVSVEDTIAAIRRLLRSFGVEGQAVGEEAGRAVVAFTRNGLQVRFAVVLPEVGEFGKVPSGVRRRTADQAVVARDAEERRRWRVLYLRLKAKVAAVQDGVAEFEEEFLPQTVVPNSGGRTVAGWLVPQLPRMYETGQVPALVSGVDPPHALVRK